jgi:1,4-dihydroxy-2-naphthoate octaprenyltransferase
MDLATERAPKEKVKSTITCDLEGIIETYNAGAEQLFGYAPEEVIGRKRVSLFSPGWIVLQNVGMWLKRAREEGEFRTRTVFVRKDGSRFNAEIRVTPTFKEDKQIGYCGVTTPIEEAFQPERKWWTSVVSALVVLRAPFLSASIIPAFIGGAYASTVLESGAFSTVNFILATIGVALLHLASNVFNDYFDWTSGTDQANASYFQKYSGGSRGIELGLITERGTRLTATALLLTSTAIGLYLAFRVGTGVLVFGLAGAFAGYFYTAPPLRLVARKGLGELAIGMTFGPLITGGMFYTLTGAYSWTSLLVGLPIGLLIANILLINQVPDMEADASTGKNHLVVTFGKENTVLIYGLTVAAAIGISLAIAFELRRMWLIVPVVILAAYGASIIRYFHRHLYSRSLVQANIGTIYLSILFGLAFIICLLI